MAHEIETMMYAGEKPWHGLGTYIGDKEVNSSDAIRLAGLDWEVQLRPLFVGVRDNEMVLADEANGVVRMTDNRVLGIVGNRYKPLQNKEAFNFMDGVVGGKEAMYHTAGSLRDGKVVWMLAKLPSTILVKGKDPIEQYLLLSNTHDGTGCVKMLMTPVRVVCANTLAIAVQGAKDMFNIKHTASIDSKIKAAQDALGIAVKYYKEFSVKADWLADQKFTDLQMDLALKNVFPAENESDVPTRTKNIRNNVKDLFEDGLGIAPWRGTGWAAVNAFGEYFDHHKVVKGNDREGRLDSIWFGAAAAQKHKAFGVVEQLIQTAA